MFLSARQGLFTFNFTVQATNSAGSVTKDFSITVGPAIATDKESLDFGSADEGYTAPTAQTVTVTNTGNQSITLTQPTATNYDFGTLSATNLTPREEATFTVTLTADPAKGGTVSGSGTYAAGTSVTVTATVTNTDYTFLGWEKNNSTVRHRPQLHLHCNGKLHAYSHI